MKVRIHAYSQRLWASNQGNEHPLNQGDIVHNGSNDGYYKYGNIVPPTVLGSAKYWKEKWLDLVAMVQEIGMPHYFVTLTANDAWPELKEIIAPERTVTRPVETTQYSFDRFEAMKDILFETHSVFGKVTDLGVGWNSN